MHPCTIWSDHLNKSKLNMGIKSVEWKNLVNECLMATRIKRSGCFSDKHLNPNIIMNIRHQKVKECPKSFSLTQNQIQSEALKLIREENNEKLLRIKEEKLIKKEIGKLKQILEFRQMLTKKYLESDGEPKFERPNIGDKIVKFNVPHGNGPYRVEKVQHIRTFEKMFNQTKNIDPMAAGKGKSLYESDKLPYGTNERRCVKIFPKFFEKFETEESKIITPKVKSIFQLMEKTDRRRLERAWKTWRNYSQREKNREREKKIYVDKIEAFLGKLKERDRETKAKLRTTSCKHEPKVFELPKRAKTATDNEERVEKLRKFMRDVKTSQEEVIKKLRSRSERERITFPNPKFLSQMEERREERLKRWKEILDRKQKCEEERESVKKQKEEERKQRTEQEKEKRMEELKKKRNAERQRKEEQRIEREKIKLANGHYKKLLLRSYGLSPWMKLMGLREVQNGRAVEFHNGKLLLLMIRKWQMITREKVEQQKRSAEKLYKRKLLKLCWNCWVKFRTERTRKQQVAVDWNDFKLTEKMFRRWIWFADSEQLEYLNKKEIAELHYKRKLKMKCFQEFARYQEYKKEQKQLEMRKLKWRQKVKEVLPDYQPFEKSANFHVTVGEMDGCRAAERIKPRTEMIFTRAAAETLKCPSV